MRIDIITIFPEMFKSILNESILKRAQEKKKVVIRLHNLRDYTTDKHKKVDDRPFGGGPGMVITPQPFFDALKKIKGKRKAKVILMCPSGKTFTQKYAKNLAKNKNLIILCGHYEGIDERVTIGDYVLTGGELAAAVVVDAVVRLIPGVLTDETSALSDSLQDGLLSPPIYTRPADHNGWKVPEVLLSGNEKLINEWRENKAIELTERVRPDLLED